MNKLGSDITNSVLDSEKNISPVNQLE